MIHLLGVITVTEILPPCYFSVLCTYDHAIIRAGFSLIAAFFSGQKKKVLSSRVCVRACVRACMRACVRACVCAFSKSRIDIDKFIQREIKRGEITRCFLLPCIFKRIEGAAEK